MVLGQAVCAVDRKESSAFVRPAFEPAVCLALRSARRAIVRALEPTFASATASRISAASPDESEMSLREIGVLRLRLASID